MRSRVIFKGMEFMASLDEKIFGKNTLSTKLIKYFLAMAFLMLILPPLLDFVLGMLHLKQIFYYLSLPALVIILLLFFVYHSIKKILRPIRRLLHEVKRLQDGELGVDLNITGYVEVESLAKSVDRMRNSMSIAQSFLGERDKTKDSIWRTKISSLSVTILLFIPFMAYGLILITVAGVLYSAPVEAIISHYVPAVKAVQAAIMVLFGVALATGLGYLVSTMLGSPIRRLAIAAEEASYGHMDADFSVKIWGDLQELAVRLNDLKEALRRAMKEIEERGY